ncbi:MAG: hypothetical protein ACRDOD_25035 [Streptosporangiaceae bacterium]
MTARLARDDPQTLHAATIGAAWLAVAGRILADGTASTYDGRPVREISHVTLCVERPDGDDGDDEIIAQLAEPERLAWMYANFKGYAAVAELGGEDSYQCGC